MAPLEPEPLHDGLNAAQVNSLNRLWANLTKTAPPRFDRYADLAADRDGFDPLSRYLWNIALGESLVPTFGSRQLAQASSD